MEAKGLTILLFFVYSAAGNGAAESNFSRESDYSFHEDKVPGRIIIAKKTREQKDYECMERREKIAKRRDKQQKALEKKKEFESGWWTEGQKGNASRAAATNNKEREGNPIRAFSNNSKNFWAGTKNKFHQLKRRVIKAVDPLLKKINASHVSMGTGKVEFVDENGNVRVYDFND